MEYIYEDDRLNKAIISYRNGNNKLVLSHLKFMSRNFPEYTEELHHFFREISQLANEYNDEEVKNNAKEASRQVENTGALSFLYTTVLEETLDSENNCVLLMEESLKNSQFETSIFKIFKYIQKTKNFKIVLSILNVIDGDRINHLGASKSQIVKHFFKEFDELTKEINISSLKFLGLKYYAKNNNWKKTFSNDEYINIKTIEKKYNPKPKTFLYYFLYILNTLLIIGILILAYIFINSFITTRY